MKKAFLGMAVLALFFVGCDSGGSSPTLNPRCQGCHGTACNKIDMISGNRYSIAHIINRPITPTAERSRAGYNPAWV
jgi:hypothetical protein